jgi:hypothetical protein
VTPVTAALRRLQHGARMNWIRGATGYATSKEMVIMTKIRSTLLQAVLVGCFVGSLSTGAFAGFKPTAAQRSDCMGDAFSLCSYALPNMDRILALFRPIPER